MAKASLLAELSDKARSVRNALKEELKDTKKTLADAVADVEPALMVAREQFTDLRDKVAQKLPSTATAIPQELRGTLESILGGPSGDHICEYLALPFVHGQALQPEIRRLQSAFDTCPEELALRVALQELHALEAEQAALGSELLQQPSESGGVGSSASISEASASAVDAVAKLLQGEEQRDAAVHAASFEVKRRAEAGRQSFMERVETGIPRDQ